MNAMPKWSECCLTIVALLVAWGGAAAELPSTTRPWTEYRTIMWVGDTAYRSPEKLPLFFERLRELGITTAMVFGDADPRPLLDNNLPYYVENLVNRGLCLKFNSKVADWDKFVTEWARTGRPETALARDYCLDDPAWQSESRATVERIVAKNAANHPLAYDLRDELSTTLSANPFDYDYNAIALEHFRQWLTTKYPSVESLNAEWATQYRSWEQVRPFTTDQIKNRMSSGEALPKGNPDWQRLQQTRFDLSEAARTPVRWNFAPWADFRTYMDVSLARALDNLRQAAHAADPATPVGIEGTQMPHAFGGYDLWRLSQVLDWVEPYDIAGAREIFGSFMGERPIVTTVFESETNPALRRLWHLLLEGDRGCLVWWSEDCIDWKSSDWKLTRKAKALQPVLHEMTSPLAQLFLRSPRVYDPVFLHYSQTSIQVDWLLESTVDGSTWLRRFSSFESEHNQMAKNRRAWLKALQDLGYSPRFLASEQIEKGALAGSTNIVLVLPNSWALSDTERQQITTCFGKDAGAGNTLLAEGPAGVFDGHGKLQVGTVGTELLGKLSLINGSAAIARNTTLSTCATSSASYVADRLKPGADSPWLNWLKSQLAGVEPQIKVPANAHARVHRFKARSGQLFAIERNVDYQMSEELKQSGGNQSLEQPLVTEAVLNTAAHVYDLSSQTYLGFTNRIEFRLDPWRPSLFAALRMKLPANGIVERLSREAKH
jgi:hypothetical protein